MSFLNRRSDANQFPIGYPTAKETTALITAMNAVVPNSHKLAKNVRPVGEPLLTVAVNVESVTNC